MMKQFLTITAALFIAIGVLAQNRVGFVTAPTAGGVERFYHMLRLSDSTIVVGGSSANMNWVPNTVTPTVLTSNATLPSGTGFAFIAHFSKDFSNLLNVVQFPANTVTNVFKIKTNTAPGQPTGDLYISGERGTLGYYIAKLNNNFLNGVPTALEWFFEVNTTGTPSGKTFFDNQNWHSSNQPWDVDNQGNVYYGWGKDFSFSWTAINKLNPDGRLGAVKGWTNHQVVYSWNANGDTTYLDGTTVRNARGSYIGPRKNEGDSIFIRMPYSTGDVVRKVRIVRFAESSLVFKYSGTSARPLVSTDIASHQASSVDENEMPRPKGTMPDDYLYAMPVLVNQDSIYTTVAVTTPLGPGVLGDFVPNHSNAVSTARVGDIVVDKRNNDLYFGYTTAQKNRKQIYNGTGPSDYGPFDYNSTLVAMKQDGTIKWWARMHPSDTSGTGYSANTLIDYLAIDYANNDLIAFARGYGNSTANLWKGNENIADPGGMKFKNEIPDQLTQTTYAWLGRYALDTLKIRNSTFVVEYGNNITGGTALTDPNLDMWTNPNTVTTAASYANTRGYGLYVDETGHIYILGEGLRTITTANAYQKMYKPDRDNCIDSVASFNYFIRKYTPNLSEVLYSSLLTTQWNAVTGAGGAGTVVVGLCGDANAIYTTGWHNGLLASGPIATLNVPSFASSTFQGPSALFARLVYDCPTPVEPTKIVLEGRNTHPNNTTQTYSIASVPNTTRYNWSILTGTGWTLPTNTDTTVVQVSLSSTAANVPSSVIAAFASNSCGTSLPRATRFFARPVLTNSGFNLTVGGSALLTTTGSSFVWLKDGAVIATNTNTTFNATTFGNGTYSVVVTNNCVSDTSNAVFVTSLAPKQIAQQVQVYPNPNNGQFVIETGNRFTEKVSIAITDLYGKVIFQRELTNWQPGEQLPMNLHGQAAGTYWISLQTQEGKIVKPFVKY